MAALRCTSLILLVLFSAACNPVIIPPQNLDIPPDGKTGTPPFRPPTRSATGRIPLKRLACGETHYFEYTARKSIEVGCDDNSPMSVGIRNVIHRHLYEHALREALDRTKDLECQEDCPKHTRVVSRESRCDPKAFVGRRLTGTASYVRQIISTVTVGVTCLKKPGEAPQEGLPEPIPKGPFKQTYPSWAQDPLFFPVSEWSETLGKSVGEYISCGSEETILIEYFEPANACEKTKVTKPNLEGAKAFSKSFYDRISCDRGCTKSPFKMDYAEWYCDKVDTGGDLLIRLWFSVAWKQ